MTATGYAGMINIKGIIPELLPPDELFAETPGRFRLLIKNRNRYIPSFLIKIDSFTSKSTVIPFIPASHLVESSVEITFNNRGRNKIGRIRVSSPFPVNFFTRYWDFDFDTFCIVYPKLISTAWLSDNEGAEKTGDAVRKIRGQDGELEGIREYSGSEQLRSIHWKLSARSDELLVKEFGSQSMTPLVIKLEELPGANYEEKISRAAWLIKQQIMNQPVGLILPDKKIDPDKGSRQCAVLLTGLALYDYR